MNFTAAHEQKYLPAAVPSQRQVPWSHARRLHRCSWGSASPRRAPGAARRSAHASPPGTSRSTAGRPAHDMKTLRSRVPLPCTHDSHKCST